MKIWPSLLAASAAIAFAAPSLATNLPLDGGWIGDETDSFEAPSLSSPFEFTLTGSAIFRLTDAFATGDIYTISDPTNSILLSSSYTTDGAPVPDYYGTAWSDTSFSRLSLLLGPGAYSITVTGNCGGGCPAGLAVRLDSAPGVPEPASWAMMVGGFGVVGIDLRRRQRTSLTYA